ncbi:HAMP domain-containing histidine kinase [Acidaminobacter sp. JC074]|uniref:sensor histidine kinase n=1 Tax=Acidaminobacter sp. JC074 TaxID=2530199 RepID=UPI001F1079DF|nr:HAMP domain-containing sensor histidine kinase [Acidaminobacter sp. JC074]MCH4889132.1 HAMP domain-containing histidine kinase [Acidaminobacter sp. JC074]
MKKILLILLAFMFSFTLAEGQNPERILIINSYNEGYNWTSETMNGIMDTIDQNLDVRVEYMDAKNFYSDEDIRAFHKLMVHKYSDLKIDAIITTDDAAFKYAINNRDFYGNAPIFFVGINSADAYNFDDYQNVYGIIEEVSIEETIDTATTLMPVLRTIHVVADSSPTGQSTTAEIKKKLSSHFNVVYYDNKTLDEIEFALRQIDDPNAIVLLAFYIVDPIGTSYDTNIMTERITQASTVPVFGLYDFSFNHGIVGGKLTSGYEHGKAINTIMTNYFAGELKDNLIKTFDANLHKYDYSALKAAGFTDRHLPENSLIINKPQSFIERHANVIWASVLIVTILVVYILVLRYQVKYQHQKNVLYNSKLDEADQMASLGQMINRISTELNEPLGNSLTNASYIVKSNEQLLNQFNDGKLSKSLLLEKLNHIEYSSDMLMKSLTSANELISAFQVFSDHHENDDTDKFDLNFYLKNLITTYAPLLSTHKHRIILISKDNLIIKGKKREYYKIFNNLIQNSIEHGFKGLEHKEIRIELIQKQETLLINYHDNGNGIQEKELNNIFKPLYSMKGKEHHGLGLSQIKDIVSSHKGTISCHSTPHEGFFLKIELPLL